MKYEPKTELPEARFRPIEHPPCDCGGTGYVVQWPAGKPQFKHMGRCEQCSGFGKMRA